MGRGDSRRRRGKIFKGSNGKARPDKNNEAKLKKANAEANAEVAAKA